MTPKQIVAAHEAMKELSKVPLPYKVARQLSGLNRRLDQEVETISSMEHALVEEFQGSIERNGIQFPDNETATAFDEKRKAFMEEDVPLKLPMVDLSKFADNLRISSGAVGALEGLVRFEREAETDG